MSRRAWALSGLGVIFACASTPEPEPFVLATPPPKKEAPPPEPEEEPEPPMTPDRAWQLFGEERSGHCLGKAGEMAMPIELDAGEHKYRIEGHRLVQTDEAKDALRIGVISATKDDREETVTAINTLAGWMKKKKMDVLIANGDLATNLLEMEKVFNTLADTGVLVIAFTGNTESCGSFNRVADQIFSTKKNFVNGNWVRRFDLAGATLVTLPGYHDRRFVHTGGAAHYGQKHLDALKDITKDAKGPVVITSHGPPRMSGRYGIDVVSSKEHVGDGQLTDFISRTKIAFGIHGHILEAGGRASDLAGKKRRKSNRWYKDLYVNAGTANPDPWPMLNGRTSYGLGMLVEIKGEKARYFTKTLKRAF